MATKVKTELKGEIKVGKVNSDKNEEISESFKAESLPTILLLKEGKYYVFKGNRTEENIFEFITNGYKNVRTVGILGKIEKRNSTDEEEADEDKFVWPEDPDTVVLNSTNFENETLSGAWLLDFYAPWCPHVNNIF